MRRPNWKLKWGRRAFSLLMVAVVLMSAAFALGNAGYSFSATKVIEWSEYLSPQSPLHEGDHFTDPKIQGADDATQQRGVEEYSALPPLPDDFQLTAQCGVFSTDSPYSICRSLPPSPTPLFPSFPM